MSARKRKNSQKYYRSPLFAALLIACVIGVASFYFSTAHPTPSPVEQTSNTSNTKQQEAAERTTPKADKHDWSHLEIPQFITERSRQTIEHLGYTVSYNHDWRLPNWVAYELTASEVQGALARSDKFLPDPLVAGDPVVTTDYRNSGYDRGHMAPAADMRWSKQAMKESFYMTNMCPQNHSNNAGDWKDLEELVRDLATKYGSIYICCGPIVTNTSHTIGTVRKIVVPQAFYKVLLRQKADGSWTSIGFVMNNAAGNRPLMTYMRSVDEVEQLTGIDFFYQLPDTIEELIEADFKTSDWSI